MGESDTPHSGSSFQAELVRVLAEARLSREEAADLAELGRSTVGRWCRSESRPTLGKLAQLETMLTNRLDRSIDLAQFLTQPSETEDEPIRSPETRPGRTIRFDHLIERHTELFAGRRKELADIQRHLQAPSPGYIYVEGLSGYGKTSLLAKLVVLRPSLRYHFISQAYKNSLSTFDPTDLECVLRNLYAQIEGVGPTLQQSELEDWFAHLLRTDSDDALQIVIDAIDEVDRHPNYLYGLLPKRLGRGVAVIISARTQGDRSYLREVGLAETDLDFKVALEGFDTAEIRELLKNALGMDGSMASDEGLIQRLQSQTGGDPFYLRFLVEDLTTGRIDPAELAGVPRGLSEYFETQFALLDRSAHKEYHRVVLRRVLAADSPLSRQDLMEGVDGLDSLNFDSSIKDIARFLLVNDDQYSICHWRFKEFVASRSSN